LEDALGDRESGDDSGFFGDPGGLAVALAACEEGLGGAIAPSDVFPQPVFQNGVKDDFGRDGGDCDHGGLG
jgi:hypothetical protein